MFKNLHKEKIIKKFYFKDNLTHNNQDKIGIFIQFKNDNINFSCKTHNVFSRRKWFSDEEHDVHFNWIKHNACHKYWLDDGSYLFKGSTNCITNSTRIDTNDLFFKKNINVNDLNGVYSLYKNSKIVYVGSSQNVFSRVWAHERNFDSWNFIPCDITDFKTIEAFCIVLFESNQNKELPTNNLYIAERYVKNLMNHEYNDKESENVKYGKHILIGKNTYYFVEVVINILRKKLKDYGDVIVPKSILEDSTYNKPIVPISNNKVYYLLSDIISAFEEGYEHNKKIVSKILDIQL